MDLAGIAATQDFRGENAQVLQQFRPCQSISFADAIAVGVGCDAWSIFAQENTSGDSSTPLVYNVENTGASYPAPSFLTFAQLPIIRPLPDAFRFADGSRDTSFAS